MFRGKFVWIVLASLFANLLFAAGVSAQSGTTGRQSQLQAAPYAALVEKAQQQGGLRVIFTLNTGFQPEGLLAGPAAVDAQRAGIAQAQQALVERIADYALNEPYRFETVPLVAVTVSAEGLQAAMDSGWVSAVQEDTPDAPTLAESTVLVGATTAWASGYAGAGQTVAVLDTGVDKTHAFLTGKVVSEACYSTTDGGYGATSVCPGGVAETTASGSGVACSSAVEGCNHGTHVAGIVAGKGASFSGVAKEAHLIAIQVFSRFDSTTYCGSSSPCALTFTSDQIKALERVYALRSTYNIASVNMSLGGGSYASYCDTDSRKTIIDQLRAAGIATVIASGNNGYTSSISAPACISSAVSVGSTGDGSGGATADVVSSFSNSASILTLLAPGSQIYSSIPGGGYANFQGTSMAAPHVAGAWAVLKSKNPWVSVTQVQNALTSTGLPVLDTRNSITKPRIRLVQALNAIPAPAVLGEKLFLPMTRKPGTAPAVCVNRLQDPGLEATYLSGNLLNPYWQSTSTNFGTILCDSGCGGVGPRNGTYWAWFGGTSASEVGTLSQSLVIPAATPAKLEFYLLIGNNGGDTGDYFQARIDGNPVFSANATTAGYGSYTLVSVDVSAYANGGMHTLQLYSSISGQTVNFHVDDITLCTP